MLCPCYLSSLPCPLYCTPFFPQFLDNVLSSFLRPSSILFSAFSPMFARLYSTSLFILLLCLLFFFCLSVIPHIPFTLVTSFFFMLIFFSRISSRVCVPDITFTLSFFILIWALHSPRFFLSFSYPCFFFHLLHYLILTAFLFIPLLHLYPLSLLCFFPSFIISAFRSSLFLHFFYIIFLAVPIFSPP